MSLQRGSVERDVGTANDKAKKGRTRQVRRKICAMSRICAMKKENWRVLMPLYMKEGCLVCLHWCLGNHEHSLQGHPVRIRESSECIVGRLE